jgi:protein gp37
VSVEPMLEQVDLCLAPGSEISGEEGYQRGIHWVIVGGESGPGARPFDVAWARSVIRQCREAGVPCFVKQLGTKPTTGPTGRFRTHRGERQFELIGLRLKSAKGGDPAEWPEDLRVREFPV